MSGVGYVKCVYWTFHTFKDKHFFREVFSSCKIEWNFNIEMVGRHISRKKEIMQYILGKYHLNESVIGDLPKLKTCGVCMSISMSFWGGGGLDTLTGFYLDKLIADRCLLYKVWSNWLCFVIHVFYHTKCGWKALCYFFMHSVKSIYENKWDKKIPSKTSFSLKIWKN